MTARSVFEIIEFVITDLQWVKFNGNEFSDRSSDVLNNIKKFFKYFPLGFSITIYKNF